jgi:hypothetical protein
VLPAIFAIAMGALVAAVQRGDGLAGPLALVGAIFVLLQILSPIQLCLPASAPFPARPSMRSDPRAAALPRQSHHRT